MDEHAPADVGHALPRLAAVDLERADDTAMGDDEDVGTLVLGVQSIERGARAGDDVDVVLVAGRPAIVAEVAGVLLLDLGTGEALPFAGVTLHEIGFDDDGADTDLSADDLCRLHGPHEGRGDDEVDGADTAGGVEGLLATEVGERRIGLALPPSERVPFGLAVANEEEPGHGSTVPDCCDADRWTYPRAVPVLRLFAAAREAAGTSRDDLPGATVAEVLAAARERYGPAFADVLDTSRVWLNGEPAEAGDLVTATDEVAVLPPVSGGAR